MAQPLSAIDPKKEYINTPDKLGLEYTEMTLLTADETQLHSWLITPKAPMQQITFVIAYGDAGNMSYCLPYAYFLAQRGYPVLLFDYRGFGQSANFEINPNQYYYNAFIEDTQTAIAKAKALYPDHRLAVWGFSMGTLMAGLAYEQTPFDYLIAESFVVQPLACVERIRKEKDKTLEVPAEIAERGTQLSALPIPILMINAKNDPITTTSDCKKFAAEKPKKRKLITFDGGHLQGAQTIGFPTYLETIGNFLKDHPRK